MASFLSEIHISGYKSFGTEQKVSLNNGLVIICGPQGSGKSVFLEAIRLVFLEKGKELRINTYSDALHNSANYKAKYIKILLNFDDSSEISFTMKNGVKQYRLNNVSKSFDDIDTWLSSQCFDILKRKSVIEQNSISEIVCQSPKLLLSRVDDVYGISELRKEKSNAQIKLLKLKGERKDYFNKIAILEQEQDRRRKLKEKHRLYNEKLSLYNELLTEYHESQVLEQEALENFENKNFDKIEKIKSKIHAEQKRYDTILSSIKISGYRDDTKVDQIKVLTHQISAIEKDIEKVQSILLQIRSNSLANFKEVDCSEESNIISRLADIDNTLSNSAKFSSFIESLKNNFSKLHTPCKNLKCLGSCVVHLRFSNIGQQYEHVLEFLSNGKLFMPLASDEDSALNYSKLHNCPCVSLNKLKSWNPPSQLPKGFISIYDLVDSNLPIVSYVFGRTLIMLSQTPDTLKIARTLSKRYHCRVVDLESNVYTEYESSAFHFKSKLDSGWCSIFNRVSTDIVHFQDDESLRSEKLLLESKVHEMKIYKHRKCIIEDMDISGDMSLVINEQLSLLDNLTTKYNMYVEQLNSFDYSIDACYTHEDAIASAKNLERLNDRLQSIKSASYEKSTTSDKLETINNLKEELDQYSGFLQPPSNELDGKLDEILEKIEIIEKGEAELLKIIEAAESLIQRKSSEYFKEFSQNFEVASKAYNIHSTLRIDDSSLYIDIIDEKITVKSVAALSGGQKTLLGLIFVVELLKSSQPTCKLLILDEIDAALDIVARSSMIKYLEQVASSCQILLISHHTDQISSSANRVLNFKKIDSQTRVSIANLRRKLI